MSVSETPAGARRQNGVTEGRDFTLLRSVAPGPINVLSRTIASSCEGADVPIAQRQDARDAHVSSGVALMCTTIFAAIHASRSRRRRNVSGYARELRARNCSGSRAHAIRTSAWSRRPMGTVTGSRPARHQGIGPLPQAVEISIASLAAPTHVAYIGCSSHRATRVGKI